MSFDAVMVLGKELRRYPVRARRELRARAAGAAIALREGAKWVFSLEDCLRGQQLSGSRVVADMLREMGVPEHQMVLDERTRSTREEALEAARLCRERGLRRLLVLTAAYHVERARWYFDEAFPEGGAFVTTPETLIGKATPLERQAIREGIPDAAAWELERSSERLFAGLAYALSPLPHSLRWGLEVRIGALYRRATDSA